MGAAQRAVRLCRNDHNCLSDREVICQTEADMGDHSWRGDLAQPFRRASGELYRRLAGGKIDDADIAPEHPAPKSRAKGFGACLLCCESLGIGGGPLRSVFGFPLFDLGKNAVNKPAAISIQRSFDAPDVHKITTEPDDHRAASISSRMRRIAFSRPINMASPLRKWPI